MKTYVRKVFILLCTSFALNAMELSDRAIQSSVNRSIPIVLTDIDLQVLRCFSAGDTLIKKDDEFELDLSKFSERPNKLVLYKNDGTLNACDYASLEEILSQSDTYNFSFNETQNAFTFDSFNKSSRRPTCAEKLSCCSRKKVLAAALIFAGCSIIGLGTGIGVYYTNNNYNGTAHGVVIPVDGHGGF